MQLLIKYDDGWALGINLDSKVSPPAKGVFPYDCLGDVVGSGSGSGSSSAPAQPQPQPLTTIAEDEDREMAMMGMGMSHGANGGPGGLSYLSYDEPQSTAQQAPQLPAMRSDSPIDFSSASKMAATSNPNANVPSIRISDPEVTSSAADNVTSPDPYGLATPATGSVSSYASSGAAFVPLPPSPTSPTGPSGAHTLPAVLQPGSSSSTNEFGLQSNKEGGASTEKKARRTSSLVASRDADLFLALGEVLGRDDVR